MYRIDRCVFISGVLSGFGGVAERLLKIVPYMLSFNDEDDPFHLFYVVKLCASEISADNRAHGIACLRVSNSLK